jgi:hypothetical protein
MQSSSLPAPPHKRVLKKPSLNEFMAEISVAKKKPAILSVHPLYAKEFIRKKKIALITNFYNPETLQMDYVSILKECESVFASITITLEESVDVEEETRSQASKKSLFAYRAGRITPSNMKAAARTSHAMPSQSLIKMICHPQVYVFSTKATR